MKTSRRFAVQLLALGLIALPLSGCSYNKFVGQEEAVKAQWAQVQNQLQRRNDLIPNLVETVKGYASHEETVFKDIADSRSKLLNAKSPEETIAAANQQTSAIGRLLLVVENYPNLKANEQFNALMDELSGTENRIATERMRYNQRVQEYNTSRRQFPGNITAKVFGFKDYPFFEAPPEATQVPTVNFSKPSWVSQVPRFQVQGSWTTCSSGGCGQAAAISSPISASPLRRTSSRSTTSATFTGRKLCFNASRACPRSKYGRRIPVARA